MRLEKSYLDELSEKELSLHCENIKYKGYTILENVISKSETKKISEKLDQIQELEKNQFGEDYLKSIKEWGMIRSLIYYDDFFANTILNKKVYSLVSSILDDTCILHLLNGVTIYPNEKHNQAKFHRDFDKDFFSKQPLSINAFWAIDDFDEISGGTWIVPFTHNFEKWPSEKYLEHNAIQIKANAGSVIVIDSRLIHRGGDNIGKNLRRGINHQYTKSFLKQQIDFTKFLKNKFDMESKLSQVLGFWAIPPSSIVEFRADPENRTYRSGQG